MTTNDQRIIDALFMPHATLPAERTQLMNDPMWPFLVRLINRVNEAAWDGQAKGAVKINQIYFAPTDVKYVVPASSTVQLAVDVTTDNGMYVFRVTRKLWANYLSYTVSGYSGSHDRINNLATLDIKTGTLTEMMNAFKPKSGDMNKLATSARIAQSFPAGVIEDALTKYAITYMGSTTLPNSLPFEIQTSEYVTTLMHIAFGDKRDELLKRVEDDPRGKSAKLFNAFKSLIANQNKYVNNLEKLRSALAGQDKWLIGIGREAPMARQPIIVCELSKDIFKDILRPLDRTSTNNFMDLNLLRTIKNRLEFKYYQDLEYLEEDSSDAYRSIMGSMGMLSLHTGHPAFDMKQYRSGPVVQAYNELRFFNVANALAFSYSEYTMVWLIIDKI